MKKIGEHTLTYSRNVPSGALAGYNIAVNVFDSLSRANHKHQEWTTRDGHLLGALCDITIRVPAGDTLQTDIFGLPNNWIVRNAFRKFHFLRNEMFEKAGVTKSEMGKYAHTLRPNLLPDSRWVGSLNANFEQTYPGAMYDTEGGWQADGSVVGFTIQNQIVDSGGNDVINQMTQELEFTRLVSSMNVIGVTGVVGTEKLYDEWDLHIILGHDVSETNDGSPVWDSVGMLQAYMEDRQAEIPDTTANAGQVAFNPLAALKSQTTTSGEIVEIADEQSLEEPPYDIRKDTRGSGVQLVQKGFMNIFQLSSQAGSASKAERTLSNVFLPSGWLTFQADNLQLDMEIRVKGIFECRDVI